MKYTWITGGLFVLALIFSSCGSHYEDYVMLNEQRVGDYNVSVYAEPGGIKKGEGDLLVKFRRATNGEPVRVSNLNVSSVMQMAGSPMSGDVSVSKDLSDGDYIIEYNFSMSGTYNFDVSFENGLKVRFVLTVS